MIEDPTSEANRGVFVRLGNSYDSDKTACNRWNSLQKFMLPLTLLCPHLVLGPSGFKKVSVFEIIYWSYSDVNKMKN